MCNQACLDFGKNHLKEPEICGKRIIEVGSLDVNGSLRHRVTSLRPDSYLGVDIKSGPGVDETCHAEELLLHYGYEAFDVLISTELLEHVRNWRSAISNMKRTLKPCGILLITTRSKGAEYHGFPYDFWRFELEDMKKIFADFDIKVLIKDPSGPGVLMKAIKREPFVEVDCSKIALYSVLVRKRSVNDPWMIISIIQLLNSARPIIARVLPGFIKNRIKRILSSIA